MNYWVLMDFAVLLDNLGRPKLELLPYTDWPPFF
jgi:hypothetical protein